MEERDSASAASKFIASLPRESLRSSTRTFAVITACFLALKLFYPASKSLPHILPTIYGLIFITHIMTALLGTYAAYLLLRPQRTEIAVVTTLGLLIEGYLFSIRVPVRGVLFSLMLVGGGLGLVSSVAMLARIIKRKEHRSVIAEYLILCLLTPILLLVSGFFHSWNTLINPQVWDVYSYALDWTLGGSPPFAAKHLGEHHYWTVWLPSFVVYWELALWMVLSVLAGLYYPKRRSYHEGFMTLLVIGIVGAACYGIFPSVGTAVLFGHKFVFPGLHDFYHPHPTEFQFRLLSAPMEAPRNAMPSLHSGWIFVVFLNLRGMGPLIRRLAAVAVVFTLLGALIQGHYLIDFLPSIPLAVGSAAIAARRGAISWPYRLSAVFMCFASAIAYMGALRLYSETLIAHPSLNLLSKVLVVTVGVGAEVILFRQYQTRMASLEPGNTPAGANQAPPD